MINNRTDARQTDFKRNLIIFKTHSNVIYPRLIHRLLWFFLVPHQVSNHVPFAYLWLTSLSSTPLHYEVQMRITPPKIFFSLLDSLAFQKINITIYLFMCLTHVARCTKTCIACAGPWWIKGGGAGGWGVISFFLPIASHSQPQPKLRRPRHRCAHPAH